MDTTIVNGAWKGHLGRGLAPRELQFLLSVAQGCTAKEIARTFGIAPGTVVKRLSVAMFKLGVNRQTAMIAEAMRRQIISPLCFMLASLIALHSVLDDDAMRRDRRAPDAPRRGGYETKVSRKGAEKLRPAAAIC
ncbi:helix-turn-helix transcriptional regulator [Pseudomonas alliivorans]|uniref:helix-turn-helix transcriptional regulator n=1 Tax=Pseudomonas alliivorans TaxID=2810613 RepID=UPI002ED3814C|nr:helix-turn-helix transcriptional regulator [Pseudomonas alliivorans]MEE4882405.1 helix-turn-helix transcriptional regulator [Pseudomonas alliivorans]MEE5120421.1 helix-turn-helix transcriptional regulator [Pseudomonas alliivorans]